MTDFSDFRHADKLNICMSGKEMVTYAVMTTLFLCYQILAYAICGWILKHSNNYWKDALYLALSMPVFLIVDWLWMAGFRLGTNNAVPIWVIMTLFLACCTVGSAISGFLFFKEVPNLGAIIGMSVCVLGAGIAAVYGRH